MNKAVLQRFIHDEVTFGRLTFDWLSGHPEIFTIELPFKENKPLISCIPQGLYNVVPHNSDKFPHVFRLLNVPDRDAILIHVGNYATDVMIGKELHKSDTHGCILVGFGMDKKAPMVKQSVKAMDWMRENIIGNFALEIRNNLPPEAK